MIASDLTARSMLVLPRDAEQLGIDPDELEIAQAVRMSMSIPVCFQPVVAKNPQTGRDHVIVDGGMLSNYLIWLFDCPDNAPPQFPTFGMLLVAKFSIPPAQAQALFDSGNQAAKQFLGTWDFEAYEEKFRTGEPPSRRETGLAAGD